MSSKEEHYNAQWRASAHEAVPYTQDYPECLLVLPELLDGSIAQGNASRVNIRIDFNDNKCSLKVTDNGIGIKSYTRLLSWASKNNQNTHHRYGHGSKKCLTKWNKNYNATWYVRWRQCCPIKKISGLLTTYKGPFLGLEKDPIEDEEDNDQESLMPSGFEWYIEFDKEIFGNLKTDQAILYAIKEVIRTRYSRKYFDKTEFIVQVNNIYESSKDWLTFQETLEEEVKNNNCKVLYRNTKDNMTYKLYYINVDGRSDFILKKEFPTYGLKNMNSSRIHMSLDGRTIEIAEIWKYFIGLENNHNDFNGLIGFANFEGDYTMMPTPCTTKVSFYENCEIFIKCKEEIKKNHHDNNIRVVIRDKIGILAPLERKPIEKPILQSLAIAKEPSEKKIKKIVLKPKETVVSEMKKKDAVIECTNYIYLIFSIDPETKNNCYKIGYSSNFDRRMKDYGPTWKVLIVIYTIDHITSEKRILNKFKKDKKIKKLEGPEKEYFICDDMKHIMHIVMNELLESIPL